VVSEILGQPESAAMIHENGVIDWLNDLDHFGDFNGMILDAVAALNTGFARFCEGGAQVAEFAVFQHAGKLAGFIDLHGIGRKLPKELEEMRRAL
jgi:hypothetical protein